VEKEVNRKALLRCARLQQIDDALDQPGECRLRRMALSQRQVSEAAGLDKLEQIQRAMSAFDNRIIQLKSEIEGIEAYANHILTELTEERNKETVKVQEDIDSLIAEARKEGISLNSRLPDDLGRLATS
jgi:hypothetical protein